VTPTDGNSGGGPDDAAIEGAAEALRQAEIEAITPEATASAPSGSAPSGTDGNLAAAEVAPLAPAELANMSIDELRGVAAVLDVPDREKIIEQDELIEAIRRRLPR
jgi:hypothetical protein